MTTDPRDCHALFATLIAHQEFLVITEHRLKTITRFVRENRTDDALTRLRWLTEDLGIQLDNLSAFNESPKV